ncbi:LLM class flavin-dependent oxidoreductase [Streptomyces sp. NPDC101225]|uniref:LLM class flavin-dependent oxidoreductase n=1 Tax=Streptomyces sp. NPDC101225 TaxID=3366135 RepID=UPI0038098E04
MAHEVRNRMRFGVFLPPLYRPSGNPSWDLERSLQLAEKLDALGFDELYFGEHHSGGWEIFGSPEIMIAAAAQRTQRINLGTGVISLPYHHPFNVADRALLLDHLTRGRAIIGVGPGALPSDAAMLGIDYTTARERMEESLEAILALLEQDGHVDRKTEWFELCRAQLHMKPYTRPRPEFLVTAVASPSGPRLAGRLGLPMLALTVSTPAGKEALAEHWRIAEEEATKAGRSAPDRARWRLVTPMHIAPTTAKAEDQVAYGIEDSGEYFFRDAGILRNLIESAGLPPDASKTDVFRSTGMGVIGTPQDAIEHIEGLQETSGGFGTYLIMLQDWADHTDTLRSLELFAEYVMPHFQDATVRREENWSTFQADSERAIEVANEAARKARETYERSQSR